MSIFNTLKPRTLSLLVVVVLLISVIPAATAQESTLILNGFNVGYGGRVYDAAANATTFTYVVTGVNQQPDLSHFDVGMPSCTPPLLIVSTSPVEAVSFGVDPTTGVSGIKWDLPLKATESRTYSITFVGSVAEGTVDVAVKGGPGFELGSLPGPSCETASIDVDKFVSSDGVTWDDADDAPGPQFEEGDRVWFRFDIANVGNVELSAIALSDNLYDTSACSLPATLAPGVSASCTVGPLPVATGQHTNVATASAVYNGTTVSATDSANYFSGDLPRVRIDKFVAKHNNDEWRESVRVKTGRPVSFRFVVTNIGNVPLTNLVLTDTAFDTASCTIPASLEPGLSFECVIGPFDAGDTDHTNTATISAMFEGLTVTDTDTARYTIAAPDEDDSVIIIIEGPIENINVNIITIFDIDIEVDINDPILNNIRIGDVIRVEGDMLNRGGTIIIIAVTIIIIDIDIIVVGPPSGPIFVPIGCKITGIGNNNPRLKCSGRSSRSSRSS